MAINRLERGEADVSIAALPDSPGSHIHFIKLLETPLIFIAPKNYPETIKHTGGHIDWQQTPVILAERGLSRKRTEAWFRHKQISPNLYAQVAGNEAIITLVSMGCGVGVIPELVLLKSPLRNQVRVLNTFPKLQPFSVGVCTTRKNLNNPIVHAFLQNVAASRSGDSQ